MLITKLEAHIAGSGLSKTDVVVAALSRYLGISAEVPLVEKVNHMEKRLAVLEQKIN